MVPGLFSQCIWKWLPRKTRRWSKAGKRTLTEFSSLCVSIFRCHFMDCFTDSSSIDWSILCRCSIINLSFDSRHSAEPTRHLQFLPCEYIPDCLRRKSIQHFGLSPYFSTYILPTKLRSLGEFTLVLELDDQSYLCSTRYVTAAVGKKVSQGHSAALQFTQASTDTCVLRRRRRRISTSVGGRIVAYAAACFSIPILCWPGCIPM
jgi:hypothetical protein